MLNNYKSIHPFIIPNYNCLVFCLSGSKGCWVIFGVLYSLFLCVLYFYSYIAFVDCNTSILGLAA